MNPVILFRRGISEEEEFESCKKLFKTFEYRSEIPKNSLVIPRYSALPYYKELERDVKNLGSKLINSYRQHSFVANVSNWYPYLKDFTPKTWFSLEELPENTSFVLKGNTNSMKFSWDTHMFAKDKRVAIDVFSNLQKDNLVGRQDIIFREYVPLKKVQDSIAPSHPPFSEEYRIFVLGGKILAGGFYWSSAEEETIEKCNVDDVPIEFVDNVIDRIKDNANFYVIDVARTESGEWIVIELNDGQQSGLPCMDSGDFYCRLDFRLERMAADGQY